MSRKVLMICYYYPPLLDVAVRRSVGFAVNLKKFGWTPYVLSVKNPDKSVCVLGDEQPPPDISVSYERSIFHLFQFFGQVHGFINRILNLFRVNLRKNYFREYLCIPDHFIGWIPGSFIAGIKLIRRHKLETIYVSCRPFSAGITGILLKKYTGKPLVLDFRDPFTVEKVKFNQSTKFRKYILKKIEKWMLSKADIFIVTSEETRNAYINCYPWIEEKSYTIHNGVDLPNINKDFPLANKNTKFTIIYAGLYFYTQHEWDPEFFFNALNLLKQDDTLDSTNFQFIFYGEGYKGIQEISEKFKIHDLVYSYARIPYQELIPKILSSHLQLLRTRELAIPAKLFDGIYLNVPFLATIPEGETASLIRKYSPSSYIITEQKPEPVADAIQDAMKRYENNDIFDNYIQKFENKFSREKLTKKLIKILETL